MTECNGWEQQPGGLYIAVQRFNKSDPDHRGAAENIMRSTVQTVSGAHNAAVNGKGFHHNMGALYRGDIFLDLFLAKWELCTPKPICVGAAINWKTYGVSPNGKNVKAGYTEDVCILTSKLRELIRTKPFNKQFPDEGLAESFDRLCLRKMKEDGNWYRYGEVNEDNTKMMRTLGVVFCGFCD